MGQLTLPADPRQPRFLRRERTGPGTGHRPGEGLGLVPVRPTRLRQGHLGRDRPAHRPQPPPSHHTTPISPCPCGCHLDSADLGQKQPIPASSASSGQHSMPLMTAISHDPVSTTDSVPHLIRLIWRRGLTVTMMASARPNGPIQRQPVPAHPANTGLAGGTCFTRR
jgi:hypothetical protein